MATPVRQRGEIFWPFLKFGFIGFGGPIALLAMFEEEFVRRRQWLTHERFSEALAVLKALPGPMATQMALFIGRERGGLAGGLVAGVSLILPAFLMMWGVAWLYQSPAAAHVWISKPVLSGMQAAALAAIALSVWSLGRGIFASTPHRGRGALLATVAAVVTFRAPAWEPVLIVGAGVLGVFWYRLRRTSPGNGPAREGVSLWLAIFVACFHAGAFTFGTGLAILPMLESQFVDAHGWLTHEQFFDGVTMGQVSPGPVVIAATFMGYLTAGFGGAVAATMGVFLAGFLIILGILPRAWRYLSGTPGARAFSAWALPTVVGAISGSALRLGVRGLTTGSEWTFFVIAFIASAALRVPSWALIPAAGVAGAFLLR